MIKSRSYPRDLNEINREEHQLTIEALESFKEKDQQRAEQLASIGSPSSRSWVKRSTKCDICFQYMIRFFNYILERSEEDLQRDSEIQGKSYVGFYYFLKWFTRSIFIWLFTTLSTLAGKEVGCAIKDGTVCKQDTISLLDSSPHLIANIIGFLFGLIIGQWIGHLVWDNGFTQVRRCLRKCEKKADSSKIFLFMVCFIIYGIGVSIFVLTFRYFIQISSSPIINQLIGGSIGSGVGLIMALIAYSRHSICSVGQETPGPLARSGSDISSFTLE